MVVASCSTKKNTATTRFWHAFTAKYNIYYNGTLAYIEASKEKEDGNKDNFTELIPLYTIGNKASRELGKSNYDIAITKAEKAIQLHSIKAKPEWNKDRKKTDRDIEWLSRREYNPFIWKAWMLLGRSQFYKGEFDEAASVFAFMSRLYKTQPAIYGKARAWLAKCYIESGWIYDAEDVIRNMQRDSIDWRAQKEWDYTLCDYYLHTGDLPEATKYLRKVIKHEMRSKQRAREYYLLGQIEAAQGHNKEAYRAFSKVISQHPSYELRFNAHISMTEVMAYNGNANGNGNAKKMISKLRRMARNDNNKEYLDQIYYAIGNIYLAQKDTLNAIYAYEKGNEGATRSGIEKGVLLLHLGDLYWETEKYGEAKRCYGEAIGLLDKDRSDYAQMSERSKVLDELVPYTDAIQLQDSLQALSRLPERELMVKIDNIIEALKKKEKEEAREAIQKELDKKQPISNSPKVGESKPASNTSSALGGSQGEAMFYFYSPIAVQQGKQQFERLWGKRDNVDDWQRLNKTVVDSSTGGGQDGALDWDSLTDEQRDSIAKEEERQEMLAAKMDSAVNDPHKREFYLAQIPFTDEQKAESNKVIMDALLKSAIIFKDKLNNLTLSEKAFRRLEEQYPEYEPKDEAYYHLFLLHSRKDEHDKAKEYIERMKAECPDSKWTLTVTDPYFYENARYGKHIEDSLYGATYEAFKADRFKEVYDNVAESERRFSLGDNRDRFLFLYGMSKLNEGDTKSCTESMERVVKEYPNSDVSEMAGMIINGVKAGKRLYGAKFDLGDVWNRRTDVMTDADSIASRNFSTERNTDFIFVFAYTPDSLKENQLLFQLARYNFTSFMVRNFDITIDNAQGMHHMMVSGFRNFDEARQYSKILMQQEGIKKTAQKARPLIISKENLELIGQRYSYNDYDTFYVKHFAPLAVVKPEQLYEEIPSKETAKPSPVGREGEGASEGTPRLPDTEAAPAGVQPVDPNAEKELESEDTNVIAVSQETEIAVPEETIEVAPAETIEVAPAETIIVPETPAVTEPSTEIDVIAPSLQEKAGDESSGTEIVIPEETEVKEVEEVIEVPVPVDVPAEPSDIIIIEDAPKKENTDNDEIIIIEDEKKSMDALEDEYYELDGF
ncbi:MAG: tetratricopeptide repeat protein [Prevotella sp.]|nr:tetratricopeptide repeat protein [Prevotella sp.]